MAATIVLPSTRSELDIFLNGDTLSGKFQELFQDVDDAAATKRKTEKKKVKKKVKSKTKDKKPKRDKSPEIKESHAPNIELSGNPSVFNVYSAVRQALLERCMKEATRVYQQSTGQNSDTDSEDDTDDKFREAIIKLPKIVGLGLRGVFELVKETRYNYPELCVKAMKALLDMLQGQVPESMKNEPPDVVDGLFQLLMEIATVTGSDFNYGGVSLTSLACSALISLVIAHGDTGKLLTATSALLMSPGQVSLQCILVPGILASLQKSVQAVLLGKTQLPDWFSQGVKESSQLHSFKLDCPPVEFCDVIWCLSQRQGYYTTPDNSVREQFQREKALIGSDDSSSTALSSDGKHLYVLNKTGLYKVGSGYSGTVKGHIYSHKKDFPANRNVWLAYAGGKLLCRSDNNTSPCLCAINNETLELEQTYDFDGHWFGPCAMFCDGEHIGQITAAKDDSFVVRMFNPQTSPMQIVSEVPLKLTRKCVDVFGMSAYDLETDRRTICTGLDEDIGIVTGAKEFSLIKTTGGKVLYAGKSQALGIKQGGAAQGKWAELPITKSPKIMQVATGHEGQHALLVSEDGSMFFVGTPRRGEDGDTSTSKGRRQPKPVKPKKMIRLESKNIVYAACNNGTSAVVTKEGEVYMFGKDTTHCDHASGHVTDLKDVIVVQMSLGKAHAIALTNKGQIYTYGINNKGQCGRDFTPGAAKDAPSNNVTMAEEEEEVDMDDVMCPPGKHKWKQDQCMVCFLCGECTGYGLSCINSGRTDRNPGMPCGCGAGEAGCTECGACRVCAGEQQADGEETDEAKMFDVFKSKDQLAFDLSKDLIPLNLIMGVGRGGRSRSPLADFFDRLKNSRALKEKNHKIKSSKQKNEASNLSNDQEGEFSNKIVSIPPAEVTVGSGEIPITQISCGTHHTVVLLQNGEVYTFGSNQYGQLGVGDTVIRGSPAKMQLPGVAVQVAAGSHHTVILLANGQVLTCGNFQKGALGRQCPDEGGAKSKKGLWYTLPGAVPGVGARFGRRATWIGASGDQTYMRIDESLINAQILSTSKVFANHTSIGLIPMGEDNAGIMKCLMINKMDGSCRSFNNAEHVDLSTQAVCLDPGYDVLWSYSPESQDIKCYNVVAMEARSVAQVEGGLCDIFKPEVAVPTRLGATASRSHCALHILGCLDTLTTARQHNLTVQEEAREKQAATKVYAKEDFSVVNRFESHGGGWGYSGHSVEAVRFMCDTDILLGGFGLFGGRGEYYGRIKLFELGPDGGENEGDGEVLAETEEVAFECGAREKHAMLFDEPVLVQANCWYVAWARISGPSSDCGSSGQAVVTTEDQVIFKFKSSKKSNNGTDVNAGQIPQLLYRLPSRDSPTVSRKSDNVEPAHVLSRDFSSSVSAECFDALLRLLEWSWNTFHSVASEMEQVDDNYVGTLGDLHRLVYISCACLRLVKTYVTEIYPDGVSIKKGLQETSRLAESVGSAQELLRRILAEEIGPLSKMQIFLAEPPGAAQSEPLVEEILTECHLTFRSCFHAFYPTGSLKWLCLCDLLTLLEPGMMNAGGYGRLLAAIMEAMCHPTIKLTNIMPINCEPETEEILRKQSLILDDNTNSMARLGELHRFPLLVDHMTYKLEVSGVGSSHISFKEILDRMLMIVTYPIRQQLGGDQTSFPKVLVANTCALLSTIVSELAATSTGIETNLTTTSRPLLVTPNRFTRTSQTPIWNSGNGSPDAIEFSVDKPGIIIAGICVYGGGGGHYTYEVELLDEQSEGQNDPSHTQRWNSIEIVKGQYGPDDCINDIAEIKFDRPVPIKEGAKYAVRVRNSGPRTLNGDSGVSKVKCPDGTTFTFTACSLSSNGTNHMRGQIPQLLYYSAPKDGENQQQNNKSLAELQARKNAIDITSAICRVATDLLHRAQSPKGVNVGQVLRESHLFSSLLPLTLAYIGPVASQDHRGAVQVLGLIQEILPAVVNLVTQLSQPQAPAPMPEGLELQNGGTTSQHYAIVESDHPYKPATVANYKVTFPDNVKWMSLEFDPLCGTAQPEDTLQLFIPSRCHTQIATPRPVNMNEEHEASPSYWPVLRKFCVTNKWPRSSVIMPGNEVMFSLETASDYVKDDKATFYGFKCSVVGYEWDSGSNESLKTLERELAYLGGMCAASLIRKDIPLPPVSVEELEEDMEYVEESAQFVFNVHSVLLGKGFALSHPPTIMQALEGNLPFCWQSNERAFLKDFVSCSPATSGGRLARWLQPDSYVDPKQCEIVYNKEELKCSWPALVTVLTKDQYGQVVHVPNLRVEVKAVPVDMDTLGDEYKRMRRLSRPDEGSLTFGGHSLPNLDTPYEVTIKDRKDAFHAISMMKAYENYSFEELRYAAPSVPRPIENMLVRDNEDGTFSSNWTPGSIGFYNVHVCIDGFDTGVWGYLSTDIHKGEVYKVEVKEPPQGMTPPSQLSRKSQRKQMRKFIGKNSAGLRIRTNPSLQSEQIGVIKPEGILSFMDEIHNDDGVWLRLSADSIKEWCNNGYSEAWCLQYNQHLGKTLLVPLEEPKSIIDEIINETIRKLPQYLSESTQQPAQPSQTTLEVKRGPGTYEVVKCGSFGHNIRSRPNLKATPIGRLTMGSQVNIVEDAANQEGVWVKLDHESIEQYCQNKDGEAWTLASSQDGTLYLQHESQITPIAAHGTKDPFSFSTLPITYQHTGFNFGASHHTSSFPLFGQMPSSHEVFVGRRSSHSTAAFSYGFQGGGTSVPSFGQAPPSFGFGQSFDSGSHHHREIQRNYSLPTQPNLHSRSSPLSFSPRTVSPVAATRSPTPGSPKFSRKEAPVLPSDLQGVSVKELVKALGCRNNEIESTTSNANSLYIGKGHNLAFTFSHTDRPSNSLRSISPKQLAYLQGESRANGNGPTPVPSPPGSPRRLSRSSSPQLLDRQGAGSPRSTSPRSGSPLVEPTKQSSSPRQSFSATKLGSASTLSESSSTASLKETYMTPPDSPLPVRKGQLLKEASFDRASPPGSPALRRALESKKEGDGPWTVSPRYSSPTRSSSQTSSHQSGSPHSQSSPSLPVTGSPTSVAQGTQEGIKPAFSIGATVREEAGRMSPKPVRKDRGRSLRSKRERPASPSSRDLTPMGRARSSSASMIHDRPKVTVKEALSTSVAECLRAVFAAFLWHEGIVHDAMACASFLKFNPNLTKELSTFAKQPKKGEKQRVRHATDSSKDQNKRKDNTNINETRVRFNLEPQIFANGVEKMSTSDGSEKEKKEKRHSVPKHKADATVTMEHFHIPKDMKQAVEKELQLPPTLQHLVYFWEELATAILKVIQQELMYPSPAIAVKSRRADKKDKDKEKDKKSKKKEVKQLARGNLFADALAGMYAAGPDRETVCDLCGGMFPHPVTYHMRQAHPGCGRHAGGKGYNSGGYFCGGWAGNCGEGGIGGSSWYLICEKCREKYFKEKRQAQKEKDKSKKLKKKNTAAKQPNLLTPQETHLVLKNNAMFLLDLASASGFTLPTQTHKKHGVHKGDLFLPSVTEEYRVDLNPFPQCPFQYLINRGAQASDSAFADDFFIDAEERVFVRSGSLSVSNKQRPTYRPRLPTEPRHSPLARSGSLGQDLKPSSYISPPSPQDSKSQPSDDKPMPKSAGTSPDSELEAGKKSTFQRSISEFVSDDDATDPHNLGRLLPSRRRNNSGGVGDGGTLLKHPSAEMTKLICSVDKSEGSGPDTDKTLQRPVMAFIIQRHDLEGLQLAMRQALRKSTCRVFAMQALNWLIRSVVDPVCLHDLMWFFVYSLTPSPEEEEDEEEEESKDAKDQKDGGLPKVEKKEKDKKKESVEDIPLCDHPLSDITIAGKAVDPLPHTFHCLLQTIADVMMQLRVGSALQQMAVRCWCLKFQQSDHLFLHESHVFSNISQILSKSDEMKEENNKEHSHQVAYKIWSLKDLTSSTEIQASSRQAMIASLSDNSTETFWESGDEDRNKLKSITITCQAKSIPKIVYVHIDNTRDLGSKVTNVVFNSGPSIEELKKVIQVDVDNRHIGWLSCPIDDDGHRIIQIILKGPDHSLRVRQVKVLGEMEGENIYLNTSKNTQQIQQDNCEAETLKVFRILTSQVFGRLIADGGYEERKAQPDSTDAVDGDHDLKEHMVGILFSRSKLTHLQKQVCYHIVQGIRKETQRVREEWEHSLGSKQDTQESRYSDVFCFELLSMMLALSGSGVGRAHLAQQFGLLQDLFSLLHTATPRVQRQVISVLRRVLPDVKPQTLANILSVPALPLLEYSIVSMASQEDADRTFKPETPCILDVFLACIAKALTVQAKVKVAGPHKGFTSNTLSDLPENSKDRASGPRWWLRGSMSSALANSVISLIQDMTSGTLSEMWSTVTKAAIAEAILSLTKLSEDLRQPQTCIKTPTLWLALASLCVLDQDHVGRLTSGEWISSPNGQHGQPRPTCDNHDDGETPAIILCQECGNLCADCDRFLHLHKTKRDHQRQVFKEEEEAIKVDLHEGCGRTKLFWIMALADSKTLKAMVEFREGKAKSSAATGKSPGTCRFCGTSINTGLLAIGNVCLDPNCQEYANTACSRVLSCSHHCGGIKDEVSCLPCLHRCRTSDQEFLKQDADDMCMICFTEALSAAPAILMKCGHVFHYHCIKRILEKRWVGPRITFGFSLCPICKSNVDHPVLKDILKPIQMLYEDVRRKALMRLEYEGLHKAEAITTHGARFFQDPAGFAMDRYAYYVCFKCNKAYYGGEARCDEQAGVGEDYDPRELVCGGCSDVSRAQMCPKHGTDFLEYKCRYCCSVAVFFCFGTTHFCNLCHDDFQHVTNITKSDLPHCPAGPRGKQLEGEECPLHVQHPPTGEEFALGCGVCRNAHTF